MCEGQRLMLGVFHYYSSPLVFWNEVSPWTWSSVLLFSLLWHYFLVRHGFLVRTHDPSVNTLSVCSTDVSYHTWLLDRFWGFKVISFCLLSKLFAIVMSPESLLKEATKKGSSHQQKLTSWFFLITQGKSLTEHCYKNHLFKNLMVINNSPCVFKFF